MQKFTATAMLAGIVAFGAAGAASAQVARVELSGRVYHAAVCPGPAAPRTARCHAHVVTDSRGTPLMSVAAHGGGAPAGFSPSQLRTAYGITGSGSASTTVAIVDAYGYPNAESDLAAYRSQFGLPACTTANGCFKKVNESGGTSYPRTNTGWDQEQALDLDMVSAMCPNCHILLVQATSTSYVDLGTAVNEAAALRASVISNSYGGSEAGTSSYESYYNHPNIAVLASAGDSGYGAQFPATSPHVIAAGGTHLVLSPRSETVWSGTGSGCSKVYPEEGWQANFPATGNICGMRMETDVSAVADPATGVAVYGPGSGGRSGWLVFGGTSVASPLLGGIFGEKGDSSQSQYPAQGLYTAGVTAFNDVTSGSNGSCGGSYFCTGETGYDGPTGLGTPKGDGPF
jgi:hypothetical protein